MELKSAKGGVSTAPSYKVLLTDRSRRVSVTYTFFDDGYVEVQKNAFVTMLSGYYKVKDDTLEEVVLPLLKQ